MRSKIGRQVLSFVLSIVFVLELVPASALAVGSNSDLTEETEATDVLGTEETACVIGEMDELREEAVKHFRMSDGSFLAVQYDGPVHYQDTDGEWQNIDTTQVSVSGSTDGSAYTTPVMLASYAYENNTNGRLAQMTYGNGETVSYTYDLFDRKTAETYNDGAITYHYEYDAEGSLAGQYATDAAGATTEQYSYEYDSLGRLIRSKELDGSGSMVQRTEHLYDTSNRLTAQNWMFANDASFGQDYTYSNGADGDGTLTTLSNSASVDGTSFAPSVTYTYTPLRQVERKTTDNLFYRAYSYRLLNGGERRSAQVEFMNYRRPDDNSLLLGYRYTYDEQGNVSAVYKSNATGTDTNPTWTYTYDGLGQLSAATDADAGYSYAYTYDTAGNIRSAAAQAMKLHFLQKKLWNTWFQSFLLGAGRSGHFP